MTKLEISYNDKEATSEKVQRLRKQIQECTPWDSRAEKLLIKTFDSMLLEDWEQVF